MAGEDEAAGDLLARASTCLGPAMIWGLVRRNGRGDGRARVDGGSAVDGVFYGEVGGGALHPPVPCEGGGEDEASDGLSAGASRRGAGYGKEQPRRGTAGAARGSRAAEEATRQRGARGGAVEGSHRFGVRSVGEGAIWVRNLYTVLDLY
jgi:hypothetical protein